MSNYPPSVTGNEPEIAGYPERGERVECGEVAQAHFRHQLLDLNPTEPLEHALDDLATVEVDCEFEGVVEGVVNGLDFEWTCPWCGAEHEESDLYAPDPDLQWERRYD